MDLDTQLLGFEEQFWKADAAFYRRHLTDGALMVFPQPVGVLTRDQTVETIATGPRWAEVRFDDVRVLELADDVAVLTYRASAHRAGTGARYTTLAASVYTNRGGTWRLAFHQQTPSEMDDRPGPKDDWR